MRQKGDGIVQHVEHILAAHPANGAGVYLGRYFGWPWTTLLACLVSIGLLGSEQEFVETRILGGLLKNDEFGLGDRHALGFEQQIA